MTPASLWAATRRAAGGGVVRILSGSLVGQGVVFVTAPVLTRLYSPGDFGLLATVTAVSTILGAVVAIGLDRALIVPRSEVVAGTLAAFAWAAVVCATGLVALAAWLLRELLAAVLSPALAGLWWVVPVSVLAIGAQRVAAAQFARRRDHAALALRNGVQGVAQVGSSIALVPLGTAGLVLGPAIGRLLAFTGTGLWRCTRGRTASVDAGGARPKRQSFRPRFVCAVLHRYRRFVLVTPWSGLLNVAGQQLPYLLIAAVQGQAVVGAMSLTTRVLATPIGMVADAVSQWFIGSMGESIRAGRAQAERMVLVTTARLACVAGPFVVLVILCAPGGFALAFGEEWRRAGQIAAVMAPLFGVQLAVSPVSHVLTLFEQQGLQLIWDGGRLCAVVGAITAASFAGGGAITVVGVFVGAATVAYAALWICVLLAARRHDQQTASE